MGDSDDHAILFFTTPLMAREHEARLARNMISNHTDMYDNYCGDCYDIHTIQSQYKGNHKRGGGQRPPPLYIGFE